MKSRRGQLLIASPSLSDPNFFKTVVLIVKDDEEGALGVVLNRPLEISVADACSGQVDAAADIADPIYRGGPCEGPLSVLHANTAAGGDEVVDGVHFTMDKEEIEWLMSNNTSAIKYFAGYSGWGEGQLQSEIDQGGWILTPATQQQVFEKQGDWSRLNTWLSTGRKIDLAHIPDDPNLN